MKPIRKPVSTFPKQTPDHPDLTEKSSSENKSKILVRFRTNIIITESDVKKSNAGSSTASSDNVNGSSTVLQMEEDHADQSDRRSSSPRKEEKLAMTSGENNYGKCLYYNKDMMIKKRSPLTLLTKKEIEHDFLQLTGVKPKRNPRRRDKNVQKSLDSAFPGLYLQTITSKDYN